MNGWAFFTWICSVIVWLLAAWLTLTNLRAMHAISRTLADANREMEEANAALRRLRSTTPNGPAILGRDRRPVESCLACTAYHSVWMHSGDLSDCWSCIKNHRSNCSRAASSE